VARVDGVETIDRKRYSHALGRGISYLKLVFSALNGFNVGPATFIVFTQWASVYEHVHFKAWITFCEAI
jgi:hypothetical protein